MFTKSGVGKMTSDQRLDPDDTPYREYADKFKEAANASQYRKSYTVDSMRDLANLGKIMGLVAAWLEVGKIRHLLESCRYDSFLDVPCGTGKVIGNLSHDNANGMGIDSSEEMLKRIPSDESIRFSVAIADIRRIPLKDQSIDLVICHRFLHRIPRDAHSSTLSEIARVSRSNIILYYAVRSILTGRINRIEMGLEIGNRESTYYMTRQEIEDEVSSCGLEIVKRKSIVPIFSTGYLVLAKKRRLDS
jgi:SAM-dependent methyltransferase